jgi:hypothetical protein
VDARADAPVATAARCLAAGAKRAAPRAWSTEEHDAFLQGLAALGRGRWATLARGYVPGRTPAQVSFFRARLVATISSCALCAARRPPKPAGPCPQHTHTTLLTQTTTTPPACAGG